LITRPRLRPAPDDAGELDHRRPLLPPPHQCAEDAPRHEEPDREENPDEPGETALQRAPARLARIVTDRDRRARTVPDHGPARGPHVRVQPPPELHPGARVAAAVHVVLVANPRRTVDAGQPVLVI